VAQHPHHRLPRRPLETLADVEYATAGWVDWYDHRRLHSTLGMIPPVECEQAHYGPSTPKTASHEDGRKPVPLQILVIRPHTDGGSPTFAQVSGTMAAVYFGAK
jgi:hypothetical protein